MSKLENSVERAIAAIETLRREGARVHCITNTVAQNFTANILLSCGATPSMTASPEEVEYFTSSSDALLINLGTLTESRKAACLKAVELADKTKIPFVLDPVMCNLSLPRLNFAKRLNIKSPAILRLNAQEAELFLHDTSFQADHTCLVVTGNVDRVVLGDQEISVMNGDPLMSKLIAIGCAQGAVMAALVCKSESYFDAALASLLWFGVCGEIAASKCSGPGSFQAVFIDTLHEVLLGRIADRARIA